MSINPSHFEGRRSVGQVFELGLPGVTEQYTENGLRYFQWQTTGLDQYLCGMAGWGKLLNEQINDNLARLVLPGDLRSASNALPGVEAFDGEKRAIIDFISNYEAAVYEYYGAYDVNLNLDTIGVGRGNDRILMLPPHRHSADTTENAHWQEALRADLEVILEAEPQAAELIDSFQLRMAA
jgi:hypothetical protein